MCYMRFWYNRTALTHTPSLTLTHPSVKDLGELLNRSQRHNFLHLFIISKTRKVLSLQDAERLIPCMYCTHLATTH